MLANSLKQDHNGSSDTGSPCVGGNHTNRAAAAANSTPLKKVVGALDEHECAPRETPNGSWESLCPAHDDNNPSLSISEVADGKVLLCCHAGCETEAIVQALGLTMADLFPPKKGHSGGGIIKTYDYYDESGTFLFQVCRYEPKGFRQRCSNGAGGWSWSIKGVRRVLYRLPQVIAAVQRGEPIYICEGEKDVEAMEIHGFVATCNSGGAGKWRDEYSEFLRGADVVIINDKDLAGRKHAKLVVKKLSGIAKSLRVVELPDCGEKAVKDAADWFAAGGIAQELMAIVATATEAGSGTQTTAGHPGHHSGTPSGEKSATGGASQPDSGQPGQPGRTPATWFNEKFPKLADQHGDAVWEKFEKSGIVTVRDLNEDFLAATLGATGTPDAPTVFIPTEDKFYTYAPADGIYMHRREPALQAGLSKLLLESARDCGEDCDTKAMAFRFRDTASLTGVTKRARGVLEVPHDYFASDLTEFIPCANGILRLEDHVLLPFSPDYRRRNKLAVPYDPTAECPLFLNTLMRQALDDADIELLQRWCGLALIGVNVAQIILILTGTAGGGKGTFIRVLSGVIGDANLGSLRTQLLGERFELGRFLGKTLLYGADVREDFLNQRGASVLKSLTGADPVTLEFKNSNETPGIYCKFNIVVTCNSRLTVHLEGDQDAWRRRLVVIEYNRPKPEHVIADLDKRILTEEGSGVLNWMLDGLDKLRADGWQLRVDGHHQTHVDNLLLESDGHTVFIRECLVRDEKGQLTAPDCYAAYVTFCTQRSWSALTKNKFGTLISDAVVRQFGITQRHDIVDGSRSTQRGWKGVALKKFVESSGESASEVSGTEWATDPNAFFRHIKRRSTTKFNKRQEALV
jgi:P4 family phage/plasmid primase-like protien